VTHIPAALRTGMPGRRHRKQDHRAISFRLPASRFSQETDQCFQARLPRLLVWSRHLEVAFRSPTAAACFQATAARSTLLADFFDTALKPKSNPFSLPLPHSIRFAPDRAGSARSTRCPTSLLRFQRLPDFHSPRGTV